MTEPSAADSPHLAPNDLRGPSLAAMLAVLPPDTLLPVRWLRERLALESNSEAGLRDTMSAQEFGACRHPRRTADWVREKCALGWFEGAYKDGGEWRIPRAALQEQSSRAIEAQRSSGRSDDTGTARSDGSRYPLW